MKAWHAALAAGVLLVGVAGALLWRARSSPALARGSGDAGPIRYVDTPVKPPSHWETLPVVARFESDPAKYKRVDGLFSATEIAQGKLGELAVSYKRDLCVWGGSACGPQIGSFHALRVGDAEDDGTPAIDTGVTCQGTAPGAEYGGTPKRSCATDSLSLRVEGRVFIVAIRDPDNEEKVVTAFTREPRK